MTDWHLVTDTFPPLTDAKWNEAFEQYKKFPEYQKINIHNDFQLSDYKFIYFWEYFHRLWVRSLGFIFLIPFIIFVLKKQLDFYLIKRFSKNFRLILPERSSGKVIDLDQRAAVNLLFGRRLNDALLIPRLIVPSQIERHVMK